MHGPGTKYYVNKYTNFNYKIFSTLVATLKFKVEKNVNHNTY